jgi:hypothetical protein
MTTIVLRADNPAGLSIAQIDGNFTNLNNDKVEKTDTLYLGTTGIQPNRASGNLSVNDFDIESSGVRPDGAADGKFLKLVAGISTWEDDSIQGLTDDTTTNASLFPVFVNSATGAKVTNVCTTRLFFNPSTGQLNATRFNALSDSNLKINQSQITDAVTIVNQLNGVEYDWKDTGHKSAGVIAQELEKILPHLVAEENGTKSVNYNGIIAYLIEAVKELDQRVKSLEDK